MLRSCGGWGGYFSCGNRGLATSLEYRVGSGLRTSRRGTLAGAGPRSSKQVVPIEWRGSGVAQ